MRGHIFHLVTISLFLFASPVFSQSKASNSANASSSSYNIGKNLVVFSEVARFDFSPSAIYVLLASNTGVVRKISAGATPLDLEQSSHDQIDKSFLLAAPFPLDGLGAEENLFYAAFVLSGDGSSFATTKVKKWGLEDLRKNSLALHLLTSELESVQRGVKLKRIALAEVEQELTILRERASKIAGVAELIELKVRLESLAGTEEERSAELQRLEQLVANGRKLIDPPEIDKIRQELGVHLKEAAKATSVADRLNKRKSKIAERGFMRKLRLINEMKSVNMTELAQKVLVLRRKRRDLESRLQIGSIDEVNDQF